MKQIIFILLLIVSMTSCTESYKDSYSLVEIKALEAIKVVYYSDSVFTPQGKFPIVKLKSGNHSFDVYYPKLTKSGVVHYYKFNPYK